MDLELTDKVVVIAGGAGRPGSIGHALTQAVAREGGIPVMLDVSERGAELAAGLPRAHFIPCDVTEAGQIAAAVAEISQRYGRIDVVVNNVGVNDGLGLDATPAAFAASLQLNLTSYWLLVSHCLPPLRASRGNVLNIASKVALTGQGGTSAYAAAKGGVLALTREWAVDFAPHGMRCNALVIAECWTPGYRDWLATLPDGDAKRRAIENNIPLGRRMTTPAEVADAAVFLLSPRSVHTTGQWVHIDGGYVHLDRSQLIAS